MRACLAAWLAVALVAVCAPSRAADPAFPTRPLRLIVPFPAGGGTDIIARTLAVRIGEGFGQQVVVDNRPGGGTVIASDIVARSTPDGHTLLLTANPHTSNPALHAKLPYDTLRDFAAITMIGSAPLLLVVHPALAARTVPELIAAARARPGELRYGSSGNGGPQHIAGELFRSQAGIELLHVPYKGSAPATTDLIAGQVQIGFASLLTTLPHVKSGRLRAVAVTGARRAPALPEIPTVAESGLPGYEAITWYGAFAPAATPRPVIAALNAAFVRALRVPEVSERFVRDGSDPVGNAPEAFAAFVAAEIEKVRRLARQTGLRLE